jgi:hypothetical protein
MDKTPTADFAQRCDTTFQTPGTFATMRDLVAREVWPSYFAPVILRFNQSYAWGPIAGVCMLSAM